MAKKASPGDKRLGNQFWKARATHGRNKIFKSGAALWEACCEYFEWVEANPLLEDKPFAYQGKVTHEPVSKLRPMTVEALCLFLDIDSSTWRKWENDEDFFPITTKVEAIIRQQKFAGAVADLMNPNIIARDLGLADKQDVNQRYPDGLPDQTIKLSPDEAYRALLDGE